MSEHITELLSAYLDGELHGSRLAHAEAHLAECDACLAELESLQRLSDLLQQVPTPEFTPPERLASQVSLRLPHPKPMMYRRKMLEAGWWMIPLGLLAVWVFMNTSFLVSDMLSAANSLGLMTSVSDWMLFGTSYAADWSAMLGQLGILRGSTLDLAAATEAFTRISLPQIVTQISLALLYLSWIAVWWVRRRRASGQLIEG